VLKWAHENGCPWDRKTCSLAVQSGHTKIVKWIHQHGCPCDHGTRHAIIVARIT